MVWRAAKTGGRKILFTPTHYWRSLPSSRLLGGASSGEGVRSFCWLKDKGDCPAFTQVCLRLLGADACTPAARRATTVLTLRAPRAGVHRRLPGRHGALLPGTACGWGSNHSWRREVRAAKRSLTHALRRRRATRASRTCTWCLTWTATRMETGPSAPGATGSSSTRAPGTCCSQHGDAGPALFMGVRLLCSPGTRVTFRAGPGVGHSYEEVMLLPLARALAAVTQRPNSRITRVYFSLQVRPGPS